MKNQKGYAYLAKGDILHIATEEKDARTYSVNGKVVETSLRYAHGYPLGIVKDKMEELIVYGPQEIKVTAQDKESLNVALYPELVELWKACK